MNREYIMQSCHVKYCLKIIPICVLCISCTVSCACCSSKIDRIGCFFFQFDQPSLFLGDRTRYSGNKSSTFRTAFVDFFTEVAHLLDSDLDLNRTRNTAHDIWRLETELEQVRHRTLFVNVTPMHSLFMCIRATVNHVTHTCSTV